VSPRRPHDIGSGGDRVEGSSAAQEVPIPAMPTSRKPRTARRLEGLDRFVQRRMKDWGVPGVAVGIVKGDRVIHVTGHGLRNVGRRSPVTPSTIFCINSATKAFTATAIGILVDEGKLEWDSPVRQYLPAFRMLDPVATERTTARDLLTHRTGLPPHYTALFTSLATDASVLERLPYLEPFRDFRSAFRYGNVSYTVAGELIEHLTGMTWQQFVKSRIFDPLGMDGSRFATEDLSSVDDTAVGYRTEGKTVVPWLTGRSFDLAAAYRPKAPPAAIVSSVADMCRWLRFQMNHGKVGSRGIVSDRILREIHTPHMVTETLVRNRALGDNLYAMGWFVQPYRGYRRLYHGGSGRGFCGAVSFLPQESLGVVVLTNSGPSWLPHTVSFYVYDRLLGLKPIPWNTQYLRMVARQAAQARERRANRRGRRGADPSRPLEDYVGCYRHPGYGRLSVRAQRGRLVVSYNGIIFRVRHCHDDVFEISGRHEDPIVMTASFRANRAGRVNSVAIPLEPRVADIVFKRLARDNG
jgi:CubicO group peptidase (beta-lactamase class C family)